MSLPEGAQFTCRCLLERTGGLLESFGCLSVQERCSGDGPEDFAPTHDSLYVKSAEELKEKQKTKTFSHGRIKFVTPAPAAQAEAAKVWI